MELTGVLRSELLEKEEKGIFFRGKWLTLYGLWAEW
jgi:hypothetical protein